VTHSDPHWYNNDRSDQEELRQTETWASSVHQTAEGTAAVAIESAQVSGLAET